MSTNSDAIISNWPGYRGIKFLEIPIHWNIFDTPAKFQTLHAGFIFSSIELGLCYHGIYLQTLTFDVMHSYQQWLLNSTYCQLSNSLRPTTHCYSLRSLMTYRMSIHTIQYCLIFLNTCLFSLNYSLFFLKLCLFSLFHNCLFFLHLQHNSFIAVLIVDYPTFMQWQ